ncbi:MAG: purine-nucleoside phosphorylase [Erysipelotrichaceae bacterium]
MKEIDRINYYVNEIKKQIDFQPQVAIVLGSGLNDFADRIEKVYSIDYKDLDGFVKCSAEGHRGRFVFGYIASVKVVIMQGRVHYYEGYEVADLVLPLRVMYYLGARNVIFTNAAGSMRSDFKPGSFMAFTDQIAFLVKSPLIGNNLDGIGNRFVDTTGMFDADFRELLCKIGRENDIEVNQGVYIQAAGPQYETVAEMKAFKMWGADAVGMSTACECNAALQLSMKMLAISCITNYESGLNLSSEPLTHQQVQLMGQKANQSLEILLNEFIRQANELNLLI